MYSPRAGSSFHSCFRVSSSSPREKTKGPLKGWASESFAVTMTFSTWFPHIMTSLLTSLGTLSLISPK